MVVKDESEQIVGIGTTNVCVCRCLGGLVASERRIGVWHRDVWLSNVDTQGYPGSIDSDEDFVVAE